MKRTGSGQKRQGEQLSNQVATKGSRRSNPTSHTSTTDDSAVAELSSNTTNINTIEDEDENEDEKEALPMPAVPADWHLNSLLVKIANEMTDNDLDAAKALFKGVDGLGRRLLSQIETPLQFFNSMQKHMFLSRDNMLFLQAMLFTIGRMDLYDMAIDYAQRLGDVIYFCKPPPEPANGYSYIQFHIKGKDFTKVKRSDLEALRMKAARLMIVPPEFVVIAGIEKSSSLLITIMVPEMFVKYFEAALTMEPAVQELTNLGIDIVRIDDKVINIHDRAFAGQRSVSKMADDSAIQIKQVIDTKGIKQCDFVIETDDVLTAEAVDSRCQTAKSVSKNLAEDEDENEDEKEEVLMPAPPDDWDLNYLLVEIAHEMTTDNLDDAKAMFKGDDGFGRRLLSEIGTPLQFFNSLQKHMFLSRNNLLFLQAMLFKIGRMDLYDMVIDYAQRLGDVIYFCTPPTEPANGYRYIQLHIEGKDFTKVIRSSLEAIRTTAARLMIVPPEFVVIAGIEPSSRLLITIMVPERFVKYFEAALTKEPAVQELTNLGIDIVRIDDKVINIHDFLTSSMSLSTLYKEIEDKAKVDRSSREIQDITSAVEEMLQRLVSGEIEIDYGYEKTPLKFRGADLQPCGSMAEETSLWKSTRRQGRENKFLGLDYVVTLHNEDNEVKIGESGDCLGCREVVIGARHGRVGETRLDPKEFNEAFLEALYSLINSKCSCHVDPDQTFSKDDRHDSRPCPKCTVAKDTGRLQIAKIPDFSRKNVKHSEECSIVFFWTSYTDRLLAPNIETLQPTKRIGRLVIRVDVLSAFTLPDTRDEDKCEKELFIIGKRCPYCIGFEHFMVSYCMHELRALKHVSDQHKQCFIIIKFLYGQFIYWTGLDNHINSYHAKVAFLTHCQTCTDKQKDSTTCITEIVQSLVEAYRSRSLRLPEFHPAESLRVGYGDDDVRKAYQIPILCPLHVLSQLKTQYRPCHVVGLIKRTCRKLLEQGRPGIMDMDGRPLENTVSTEDILVVLLADKELCYDVVYHPYHYDVKKLYHRLPCPEPERGLLLWRARCMANMILASDITHIRGETIKQVVENVQDAKKKHEWRYTPLLFLTSSQSVTEMPKNDSETSSLTPSLDGSCNNTTGWNVPTDSIFTDDLQLNWSAFTEQLIEKIRAKEKEEKERQAIERWFAELEEIRRRRLAEKTERERRFTELLKIIRRFFEETEKERREMIQKQKSKKDENETTTDADQMQVQPTDVIHEVDSSGETDDESALKNGEEGHNDLRDEDENDKIQSENEDMEDEKDRFRQECSDLKALVDSLLKDMQLKEEVEKLVPEAKERDQKQRSRLEDTTINMERKTTVEKKGDRKRKDEAEGDQSKTVTERTDNRKESRLEIKAWSVGDICEGFYDPHKKWYKAIVIKIISQGVYRVKYTGDRSEEELPQELMRPIEKEN